MKHVVILCWQVHNFRLNVEFESNKLEEMINVMNDPDTMHWWGT